MNDQGNENLKLLSSKNRDIDTTQLNQQTYLAAQSRKLNLNSLEETTFLNERRAIRDHINQLKKSLNQYGVLAAPGPGLKAKLTYFLKNFVRKLILRHIDEQKEFNLRLLESLERLEELAAKRSENLSQEITRAFENANCDVKP